MKQKLKQMTAEHPFAESWKCWFTRRKSVKIIYLNIARESDPSICHKMLHAIISQYWRTTDVRHSADISLPKVFFFASFNGFS